MTVNEAVRALRKHLGKTQQAFASELGISISGLNNYERSRTPEHGRLYLFQSVAKEVGREDLAKVFLKAIGAIEAEPYSGPALKLLMLKHKHPATRFEFRCLEALALSLGAATGYEDLAPAVIAALALVVERREKLENRPTPGLARAVFEQSAMDRGFQIHSSDQAAESPATRRRERK
jgi:transcriptional regulator with XRE-family HTH domain